MRDDGYLELTGRSHLAAFKVPRKITFLSADELPKTSTGKVQKYLLVRNRPGS